MRGRVELAYGWAEFDMVDDVRVGDRLVPRVVDVHFPSTDDLPTLAMRIEVRKGAPVCTEVTIRAKGDGREVRSVDLRAVKLEDWLEQIVGAVSAQIVADDGRTVTAEYRTGDDAHRAAVDTIRASRRASRRAVTSDLLARVADVYRAHVGDRPTAAVQRAFGTSYRTAARYVQLARAEGLLPETTQGKRRA